MKPDVQNELVTPLAFSISASASYLVRCSWTGLAFAIQPSPGGGTTEL